MSLKDFQSLTPEELKIKLAEMNQIAWQNFRKGLLGLLLMMPANLLGLSEMYYPKYTPSDYYWYIAMFQLVVGLGYFFPEHVKWLVEKFKK